MGLLRRIGAMLVGLALLAGWVAGCAGPAMSTAGSSSAPSAPTAEELQFTSTTLDGKAFSGASLAGHPAVLWFWAPWCPNCRAESGQVAAAAAAHQGSVTFVGVASLDALPAMQSFVTTYGMGGFTHLADLDGSIWQRFGVTQQPAYAFISSSGSVEVVKTRVSAAELDGRLAQLTSS
jgi:thiol-disulfide isomerase/thioredoxin